MLSVSSIQSALGDIVAMIHVLVRPLVWGNFSLFGGKYLFVYLFYFTYLQGSPAGYVLACSHGKAHGLGAPLVL